MCAAEWILKGTVICQEQFGTPLTALFVMLSLSYSNCSSRDFVLGFALVVIIHHLPVKHIGFFRQMSQNHLSKQRSLFFLPLRL